MHWHSMLCTLKSNRLMSFQPNPIIIHWSKMHIEKENNESGRTYSKAIYQYHLKWSYLNVVISWLTIAWKNFFGYHGTLGRILFNVLMSLLDQFVALSPWGSGRETGPGLVLRSCKICKFIYWYKLFVKCVLTAKRLTIRSG